MKFFAIKTDDGVEVYSLMWGGSQDGQRWSGGGSSGFLVPPRGMSQGRRRNKHSVLRERDGKVKTISCFLFYLALPYLTFILFYSVLFLLYRECFLWR